MLHARRVGVRPLLDSRVHRVADEHALASAWSALLELDLRAGPKVKRGLRRPIGASRAQAPGANKARPCRNEAARAHSMTTASVREAEARRSLMATSVREADARRSLMTTPWAALKIEGVRMTSMAPHMRYDRAAALPPAACLNVRRTRPAGNAAQPPCAATDPPAAGARPSAANPSTISLAPAHPPILLRQDAGARLRARPHALSIRTPPAPARPTARPAPPTTRPLPPTTFFFGLQWRCVTVSHRPPEQHDKLPPDSLRRPHSSTTPTNLACTALQAPASALATRWPRHRPAAQLCRHARATA